MSIRPLLTLVQKRASYGLADCGHVIRHSGYYHHTIIIIMIEAVIREQRLFCLLHLHGCYGCTVLICVHMLILRYEAIYTHDRNSQCYKA